MGSQGWIGAVFDHHVGSILFGVDKQVVSLDNVLVPHGLQNFILDFQIVHEFRITHEYLYCIDVPGGLLPHSFHCGLGPLSQDF